MAADPRAAQLSRWQPRRRFLGRRSSRGGSHGGGSFAMSRSSTGHTPSFNAPRTGFRPTSMPQHFRTPNPVNKPTFANRPRPVSHPGTHPRVDSRPANLVPRQDWAHHDWYHGNWHGHWDHPWNGWPYAWFNVETGWNLAATTPWSWGYWSYYNPYCTAPVVVEGATIDYSRPIAAAVPPEALANQAAPSDEASELLDAARETFLQGDYRAALSEVNQAVAKNPNDPLLHEFRCLVCFALKQYEEAAAGLYAVLSVGPGWDWTTLSSFYPDVDVYTQQLHALEQYIDAHSDQPNVRFLLAYHYVTCGHSDAAAEQLKAVVQLNPKDQLSAQLLAALAAPSRKFVLPETKKLAAQLDDVLAAPEGGEPADPNAAAPPTRPVDAVSLLGDWKARQPDGSTVALRLTSNSTYTWQFTRQGKTQDHSGTYAVADNLLILKEDNNPVMVGRVALLGDNRLNFKLVNDNPSDPGLTFSR